MVNKGELKSYLCNVLTNTHSTGMAIVQVAFSRCMLNYKFQQSFIQTIQDEVF